MNKLSNAKQRSWHRQAAQEVGRKRAAREAGSFSYRNATMIEHAGRAAGTLMGYVVPDAPEPIPSDMPAMFVPDADVLAELVDYAAEGLPSYLWDKIAGPGETLQELENQVPGTWYVNVLAVLPQFRNFRLGTELLRIADENGRKFRKRGMSVIVSDANIGARRRYERLGYRETARRTMVKEEWVNEGREWVLMTKVL